MSKTNDNIIFRNKYNRLKPIKRLDNNKLNRGKRFLCLCDCGNKISANLQNLKNGSVKSCGCLNKELVGKHISDFNTTHGKSKTKEYRIWKALKNRCNNPNSQFYNIYGGRGIKVCKEWINSFENFYNDMGKIPSEIHQIDRIDNDKGYSPENCRWVTPSENTLNKNHKLGKDKIRNVYKENDKYFAQVKRQQITRRSKNTNKHNAIYLRDLYINEYKDNPEKWIKDTKSKKYKR